MATTKNFLGTIANLDGMGLQIASGYTDTSSATAVDVATGLASVQAALVSWKTASAALQVAGSVGGGRLTAVPMDHATVANRGKITIQAIAYSGAGVAQWIAFGKGV